MGFTLNADRAAGSDHAVIFACDENYAPFALAAAAQIAALHPERDFDLVLVTDTPFAVPESLKGLGLRVCHMETGAMFRGMKLDARRTAAVYARLALPEAFAQDYTRILYLDADTFVQGGDFGRLLRVDLGGHVIGAVRDNIQWRTPQRRPAAFAIMGIPAAPYFNSGLLLIDVAAFRKQDLMMRAIALSKGVGQRFPGHDQNLLNGLLHGAWAELSPVWNWQYTWASRLFEAMEDAYLIHFIGPKKPWKHEGGELPRRFRRSYAAFFAQHFPERAPMPDADAPHSDPKFLRRMLLKHLISTGKMCRYLERFDDPYSVR